MTIKCLFLLPNKTSTFCRKKKTQESYFPLHDKLQVMDNDKSFVKTV